jgi:hypothetical protein
LDTDALIQRLSEDGAPVSRLRPPWLRALCWLALGLPPAIAVVLLHGLAVNIATVAAEPRMLIEEGAILATALLAALAAFMSTVPGGDRRWLFAPIVPLVIWLATLGEGCVADYLRLGPAGLSIRFDGGCFPPMVLIGVVPTIAMVIMLRRGAPLMPRVTLALGALAIAALANFGLQLFHVGDVSIMVLVWHFGLVVVVAALAGWLGPRVLAWRHEVPS